MDQTYRDGALKRRPPPRFLKQVKADKNTNDRREINLKKTIHNDALIAAVTADVKVNCQVYIHSLASAHSLWHISWHLFPFFIKIFSLQRRGPDGAQYLCKSRWGREDGED